MSFQTYPELVAAHHVYWEEIGKTIDLGNQGGRTWRGRTSLPRNDPGLLLSFNSLMKEIASSLAF
jgi:hypothetical protein